MDLANNYYVIHGWMGTKLKLSGAEKEVFAVIYGFTQDGESEFYGSRKYLANLIGISLSTLDRALKSLVDSELLIKRAEDINGIILNRYRVDLLKCRDIIQYDNTPIQYDSTPIQSDEQYNNIYNNKKTISTIVDIPAQPAPSTKRNFRKDTKQLSDDLNSIADIEKSTAVTKQKRKSIYDKCIEDMNDNEFTFSPNVKSKLKEYLLIVLQGVDDGKKIKGHGMWKGMLRQLCKLSKDSSTQLKIVEQSVNEGRYGLYRLGELPRKEKKYDSPGVPKDDIISQTLHGDEVVKELERREREVGVFL